MDFLERIDIHYRKQLPFVAYSKPGEDRVQAILQKDDTLHRLKSYRDTGFILAPFAAGHSTILTVPDDLLEASTRKLPPLAPKPDGSVPPTTLRDKSLHVKLVKKGVEEIKKGIVKKVVLSRRMEVESDAQPLDLFQKLLTNYPTAFCYLWYHPKVGLWLGATPEILLRLQNGRLTTMSLAGTQKFTGNATPEWGEKELEEQQMVTDYILDALEGSVERLTLSNTETARAGGLLHLRTKITGRVAEGELGNIVHALHPTPAVCGLPKQNAFDFIVRNEAYDREYYTGYLGELNLKTVKQRSSRRKNQENQAYRAIAKTTTLYVNLRCMQIKDDTAFIYVGGGITKDSDAEREWEEIVAKSTTMTQVL
ncbi:chorismate-binding protein [Pricia sp. S334]|uniref:Chorismate-binding protein n=1 Tax=Pricia mediterranea TaxID=3076079 RepID=A0ABU3LA78_9FLAO|nr:chorismate-binding protein [Pricia sp. S334]MDT7830138.1 chorismate-binding protein [Pricia sp. S334]